MATKVILLERIETLGNMGDVVAVKPGYARNFLLPQKKALRASKENVAYFEAKKKYLEAENEKGKKEAEKLAGKLAGLKVPLIRQASEGGQLYGSVTARDIATAVTAESKIDVARSMVQLNQNYKSIGLFPVDVVLHPEVKVSITINIARSPDEAQIQAKTGKALVAEAEGSARKAAPEEVEANLEGVLEDEALEAQKEKQAEEQIEAAEEESKPKAKAKKAKKPAAESKDEAEDEAE